ncbi:MAG TPA: hypothetical protein VLX58_14470 [Bryobacteraceae bacterium]|nr:hypothetical protein [Bryobacteraceae bacterium]
MEATLTDMALGFRGFASHNDDERDLLSGRVRKAITAYFRDIRTRNPDAALYNALVKHVTEGDSFVTFNYDVALERALISQRKFRVQAGYGLPVNWPTDKSPHVVLKLHGSTNWAAFMPQGYRRIEPGSVLQLVVDNRDEALPDYPAELLDQNLADGPIIDAVSLILPTREKRFGVKTTTGDEFVTVYDSLWLQAADSLAKCDRIVIIGYSMPKADRRARALLLWHSNRRAEVIVCCGSSSASLGEEFERHGFLRVSARGRFDDYLRRLAP